ncbi:MAG: hypothetical protein LBV67_10805 [Streptococcaceae bacterium]|jgi:hypothetical protein|nr:hypothetical protein [Streptococcaceae bacterium]
MRKKYLILVIFSVLNCAFGILTQGFGNDSNESLALILGNVDLYHPNNVISMIRWLAPQLILLSFYGNILEEQLLKNATVIFTRTNKKNMTLVKVFSELLGKVILFFGMNVLIIWVFNFLFQNKIVLNSETVIAMLRLIFYSYFVILVVNSFSLFSKAVHGLYFTLVTQIGLIYLLSFSVSGTIDKLNINPITITLISIPEINQFFALGYSILLIFGAMIGIGLLFKKKELF